MFSLFKKLKPTCESCEFYSEYRTPDQLNKDKTITKGKVMLRYCTKMQDELSDLEVCPMYRYNTDKPSSAPAFLTYLKKQKYKSE